MRSVIPFGSPLAVQRWSASLFVETLAKSYFERRFIGTSSNSVIQRLTDLEAGPGETIHYDLSVQLMGQPTYGDARLEGHEEQLQFYSDEVSIDQVRKSVSAGGRMTRKRTAHELRRTARDRLSDYWAAFIDQMFFIYLSGARGINADFIVPTTWTGFADNSLTAPDTNHIVYGGGAAGASTITASDTFDRNLVEAAVADARMMRAQDPNLANMLPVTIGGDQHYVCVMTPYQEHDMRMSTDTTGWLEIQKAAASAEGKSNPIFRGGLGMINSVVMHSHEAVIRFNNYGADSNIPAARALFMGRQAGVIAFGTKGGLRFDWQEDTKDYGNEPTVAAGTIVGVKKTTFNSNDFGVMALDTAATVPVTSD